MQNKVIVVPNLAPNKATPISVYTQTGKFTFSTDTLIDPAA